MRKRGRGFTLIEMAVTVVIAAILLALAIPSFRSLMQNNRAIAISSDFVRGINLARSEAIKRSAAVSICAANTSLTGCGTDWLNGWLIFSDDNGDGVYDVGTDTLIFTHQGITGQGSINAPASTITYNATGFLRSGSGVYKLAASGCIGKNARNVDIANNGRISVNSVSCT